MSPSRPHRAPAPFSLGGRLLFGLLVGLVPLHAVAGQTNLPHGDAGGEAVLALAGDAIITRSLSVFDEPEFLQLRELIQGASAAFVNLEILFHNFEEDVIPASASGGTYMQADPAIAKELVWMGFDMVSMANNHTGDYGVGWLKAHRPSGGRGGPHACWNRREPG